jgi:chromosome segregation ATPase
MKNNSNQITSSTHAETRLSQSRRHCSLMCSLDSPGNQRKTVNESQKGMSTTVDTSLLVHQARQENLLLREELASSRAALHETASAEHEARASLSAAMARIDLLQAELDAAKAVTSEMETSMLHSARLRADGVESDAVARAHALEARLAQCEETCAAQSAGQLREVQAEAELIRERCALSEGKLQAASQEVHETQLRAQVAEAKAQGLQSTLEECRAELSRALDEASHASSARRRAESESAAAAESAALREADLERELAEASARLDASPVERDAAIAALRKAYRETSIKLQERATAILQREVRLRMVAEERARIRALG